jgi:hypothetical protein
MEVLEAKGAKPRPVMDYNLFILKLKECLGPDKRYPRGVKPIAIPDQDPMPDHLIGNYFDRIKK